MPGETPASQIIIDRGEKIIALSTFENEIIRVKVKVASLSKMIKEAIDEDQEVDEELAVPVPNIKGVILRKILEFNARYLEEKMADIERPLKSANLSEVVDDWYAKFIEVQQEELFEIILGANYLDIQPLLDLSCAKVATMIKNKTPSEIRTLFNIENDFTPEEEAQIKDENKWCEDM